jgi:alkylation response protein AidB-like acyl-CoA dehydrogenase
MALRPTRGTVADRAPALSAGLDRVTAIPSKSMATVAEPSAPYALPQEFVDFRDTIRQIVTERVAPRAAEIDEQAEYPRDLRELFAEHDLFGLPFDTEHGGTGTGTLMLNIAVEEVAKACASSALMLMIQELGTLPIKLFGTDEQKGRFLPRCASGEWSPAFALSEPEAGSDPGGMRTRAVRDGSEWVIDGTKNWITNLGIADFYICFAVTDPDAGHSHGISAFIVEADRAGFSVGKLEHKMGIRGSPTGQPIFDGVRVPEENLIGIEGEGFKVALATLDRSRLGVGAQAVGIAQGATDYAAAYAQERRQFGKPIASFQGIQFKLADMESRTAAARELLYRACSKVDAGDADMGKYSAMAKLIASDTAMWVTTEAVQVLGGYGYVNEYPVERMMRDAKITQIYEGTNEIQRLVIARTLS